jgi:enoyl-CoA hydratase/carnithine racemase
VADEVICEVEAYVATITLNRPETRNALNGLALEQLAVQVDRLERQQDVRVIVFRGAGKAFCSGRDLRELGQQQRDADRPPPEITEVFHQIEQCRHPTIAMVHGDALAGGCELALHCDLRFASLEARFGMPLARLGLIVPFDLTCKLVETIGPAYTRQILFTAEPVAGQRAFEMGMVHQAVPQAELEHVTYDVARRIAANAPLALAGIKRILLRTASLKKRISHADLDEMVRQNRLSADAREGVRAQLEKRAPVFQGA